MDCQFYCHICQGSFSSIVTLIAAVYEIVQTIFKDEQVRGTEPSFLLLVRTSVIPAVSGIREADQQQKTKFGPTYLFVFKYC